MHKRKKRSGSYPAAVFACKEKKQNMLSQLPIEPMASGSISLLQRSFVLDQGLES